MGQEKIFIKARMHESGYYFSCTHRTLSFRHPPSVESFYLIGYGWCGHYLRYTPIEGGDKKGIVRVDEKGELYTEFYEAEDRERAMQRARRVQKLYSMKRRGGDEP